MNESVHKLSVYMYVSTFVRMYVCLQLSPLNYAERKGSFLMKNVLNKKAARKRKFKVRTSRASSSSSIDNNFRKSTTGC